MCSPVLQRVTRIRVCCCCHLPLQRRHLTNDIIEKYNSTQRQRYGMAEKHTLMRIYSNLFCCVYFYGVLTPGMSSFSASALHISYSYNGFQVIRKKAINVHQITFFCTLICTSMCGVVLYNISFVFEAFSGKVNEIVTPNFSSFTICWCLCFIMLVNFLARNPFRAL